MSNDPHRISVTILDKEFLIASPPEAQRDLLEAAADLNERMRQIRSRGKVIGLDRIAVMTALNLSHELLQERRQREQLEAAVEQLSARIETALSRQQSAPIPFPRKDQD